MMRHLQRLVLLCLCALPIIVSGCGTTTKALEPATSPSVVRTPPPVVPTPTMVPTPQSTSAGALPVHLSIPAIQLNAAVEYIGLATNGDLATPVHSPWNDVGWYTNGPRPGEEGSAVIDGHLDRPGGYPAVFWKLRYLHPGDSVIVQDAQGGMLHFHITRLAYYAPQAAPLQAIFGTSGGIYLNLITCAGDWIASQHQTTLRLVVYTTLNS